MIISVEGAIDTHVHADPELFNRIGDAWTIASKAAEAGMAGIAFKCHHESTVQSCHYINSKSLDGFNAIPGITLNQWVGGFNPEAVQAALGLGARIVWMPTMHAAYHMEVFGGRGTYGIESMTVRDGQIGKGLTVWESPGKLSPALVDIMLAIKKANAVLATAHTSPREIEALTKQAQEIDLKILVNHVFFMPRGNGVDISYFRRLVELGAMLELCAVACYPMALYQGSQMSIELSKQLIEAVGPEHCVLATDSGQPFNPWPHEALRMYAQLLHEVGVPEKSLRMMMVENPAKLLGI